MKIGIFTRSMNYDLYRMSQNTIDLPYRRYRYRFTRADDYFYRMLKTDVDVAVNIDEDAFVASNDHLKELLEYCLDHGYANCGFPDGGVLGVRNRNPLVTNPFFNILDLKAIRARFDLDRIRSYYPHKKEYEKKAPWDVIKTDRYEFGFFERYYEFFVWISQEFDVLYLNGTTHSDKQSTILEDHMGRPFLYHSWYSRDFDTDDHHNRRITNLYEEALGDRPGTIGSRQTARRITRVFDYCGNQFANRVLPRLRKTRLVKDPYELGR